MERGKTGTPATVDLPAKTATGGSLVAITAAAEAGVVAIGVSSDNSIQWVFAENTDDADTALATAGAAGASGVLRGTNLNFEIPCAGRGNGKKKLYVRSWDQGSAVTAGFSHWPIYGNEG